MRRARVRASTRHPERRGQTLVLFVLLAFVILALAAAVIDVGSIFLARRQLQSAVNSASVEGLRFRDGVPLDWRSKETAPAALINAAGDPPTSSNYDPTSPDWQAWIDKARRWAAANAANQVMTSPDDSYYAAQTMPTKPSSGVPVEIDVAGTSYEFQAAQTFDWQQGVQQYDPRKDQAGLQPNLGDTDEGGDLVAGVYLGSTDLTTTPDKSHSDDYNGQPYQRADFQASSVAGANSAFLRACGARTKAPTAHERPGIQSLKYSMESALLTPTIRPAATPCGPPQSPTRGRH